MFENFLCRSPQPSADDKMIPQFHKALEAISDSLFAQPFPNRRPLKCLMTPDDFAESTGTNTRYSDFCKMRCEGWELVTSLQSEKFSVFNDFAIKKRWSGVEAVTLVWLGIWTFSDWRLRHKALTKLYGFELFSCWALNLSKLDMKQLLHFNLRQSWLWHLMWLQNANQLPEEPKNQVMKVTKV